MNYEEDITPSEWDAAAQELVLRENYNEYMSSDSFITLVRTMCHSVRRNYERNNVRVPADITMLDGCTDEELADIAAEGVMEVVVHQFFGELNETLWGECHEVTTGQ